MGRTDADGCSRRRGRDFGRSLLAMLGAVLTGLVSGCRSAVFTSVITRISGVLARLKKHRKVLVLAASLSLVAGLGWIDLYVDRELSFLVLYLGPVLLAGWYVGRWAAFLVSLASATIWIADEVLTAYSYAYLAIPYWNLAAKFVIFLLFSSLIAFLRASLERQHRAESERVERELQIAKEVQSLMFPQSMPASRAFDCSAVCFPAREVSGDYYDCFPLDDDRLALTIADVSGKGMPAALLMARLQALLRMHIQRHKDRPAQLAREINRGMFLGGGTGKYATFVCAICDERKKQISCVNAGHNVPFLIRGDVTGNSEGSTGSALGIPGEVRLDKGGFPLGLFEDTSYEQQTFSVGTGDVLVLYTDGVVEAVGPNGEEFGMDRLSKIAISRKGLSARALQEAIVDEVRRFRGDAELDDDLTLLVVKVLQGRSFSTSDPRPPE